LVHCHHDGDRHADQAELLALPRAPHSFFCLAERCETCALPSTCHRHGSSAARVIPTRLLWTGRDGGSTPSSHSCIRALGLDRSVRLSSPVIPMALVRRPGPLAIKVGLLIPGRALRSTSISETGSNARINTALPGRPPATTLAAQCSP
jgi:hypothetical protein